MKTQSFLVRSSLLFLLAISTFSGVRLAAQTQADNSGATQLAPAVSARITQQVDNSVRVTIAHSTHPLAQASFDAGPLDPGTALNRMTLVLGISEEAEHDARTLLDSQQTAGSPNYHQWLTPEAFGQRFGPSQQDIQTVTTWLQQQGFTVNQVAKSGRWIEFSGTVAQVQTAFQTQMRHYAVGGEQHVANSSDISIPAALTPVVRGVVSLHNFYSKPMLTPRIKARRNTDGTYSAVTPNVTFNDGSHAIAPGDFAAIYNLTPLYTAVTPINGTGQTIAIVAISNINQTSTTGVDDVATFRQLFGLPVNPPNIILNGPDPGVDTGNAGGEATLDTEWSGAVAPNATIDLVVSGGTLVSDPVILSSELIVNQNLAPVMSSSFGQCEVQLGNAGNAFWNGLWEQAAAQGISVFVASGDTGAAGCDPNMDSATLPTDTGANTLAVSGFASTPFDTAVGGTEFNETGAGDATPPNPPTTNATFWSTTVFHGTAATATSALGYIPEMIWNDSCDPTKSTNCFMNEFSFASGSGGASAFQTTKPPYQTLSITGIPAASTRYLPDVSLAASNEHDPYVFCFTSDPTQPDCNGTISLAGGTSFSSPAFAGIMTLVNQKIGKPQGLANYVLYPLAAAESASFSTCNSSSRTNPATASAAACVFNDVTVGNNTVPGLPNPPGGFAAGTGFDLASGLGTVDANKLATAWSTAAANFQGTTTNLAASVNGSPVTTISVTHGQPVTLNVTVTKMSSTFTGTPSGNVGLVTNQPTADNPTVEALALTAGTTSPQVVNILPGGTYNLTANYPGDGTFGSSTSLPITVNIAPEASVVQMAGFILPIQSPNGSNTISLSYGTGLAIDALVSASSNNLASGATGILTFTDSVNGAAAVNLAPTIGFTLNSDGGAELLSCQGGPVCFTPGTHVVNGSFGGDPSLNSGVSSGANGTVTVTVAQATSTTTLGATPTTGVTTATPVTLTATVASQSFGNGPTGTITFSTCGTPPCTAPLVPTIGNAAAGTTASATAVLTTTFTTPGAKSVTATYGGDTNYTGSGPSAAVAFTVTQAQVGSFTVAGTGATAAAGGTGTSTITITPTGGFTGTVAITCPTLPPGVTCTPNPLNINVTTAAATTGTLTINTTANSSALTASLVPTSNVFSASNATPNSNAKGWWTLSGGTGLAALVLLFLPGRKRYRAALGLGLVCVLSFTLGCGGGGGGVTTPVATTTQLTVNSTKVAQNGNITVSAAVTPTTATGTVQFLVDGAAVGQPAPLTNGSTGQITTNTGTSVIGTHTLSAQYTPGAGFTASKSGTLNIAVTGTTQLAISVNPASSNANPTISLTIN